MDYALQVHEAKYIFPVPDGLKELSSDIIREVLRHQPGHINGFIADYLETMLMVREHTRDTAVVICDIFEEGRFFEELFKMKNVTRKQASDYATTIQAAWRGYVVRRKLAEWLKKKKKFDEDREKKRIMKIEELLEGMGITYDEATRAAGIIQSAYKESKTEKGAGGDMGEIWLGEFIPFSQRIRESDKAYGRFAKWNIEDFGDFFDLDIDEAIKYDWPKVGQLRKVPRDEVPEDVEIVEFYGMRDLDGQEQYSYLIKSQKEMEKRGTPIGFLIPIPKALLLESTPEVIFVNPENVIKMGSYTYAYKDIVDREEVQKFDELLKANSKAPKENKELSGEFDYDPHWVLPRVLIRIKTEHLHPLDDEVTFALLPEKVVCEEENYSFRAENLDLTAKIVRFILREECLTVEDAIMKAASLSPYKIKETGRIFPVDTYEGLDFIQKIEILPESTIGEETNDMTKYEYIFIPPNYPGWKRLPKGEPVMKILMNRFQGYHSDYRGSAGLDGQTFIMGPKLAALNGKALTYESTFWDEFGVQAWHKLLYDIERQRIEMDDLEGVEEEVEERFGEGFGEEDYGVKDYDEVSEVKEKEPSPATTSYNETIRSEPDKGSGIQDLTERSIEGEAVKDEVIKEEAVKEEAIKDEAIKEEATKEEAIKEESIKEEATKEEVTKEEVINDPEKASLKHEEVEPDVQSEEEEHKN